MEPTGSGVLSHLYMTRLLRSTTRSSPTHSLFSVPPTMFPIVKTQMRVCFQHRWWKVCDQHASLFSRQWLLHVVKVIQRLLAAEFVTPGDSFPDVNMTCDQNRRHLAYFAGFLLHYIENWFKMYPNSVFQKKKCYCDAFVCVFMFWHTSLQQSFANAYSVLLATL